MAIRRWLGAAQAVGQVSTVTIGGTIVANDTFTITIGGTSVTIIVASGATGLAAVANALADACQASTAPVQFTDVSFSVADAVITCSSVDKGKPFTIAVSKVSTSGTITLATPTAATGPNHWNNTANWSGSTLPATGDTAILQQSSVDILYGLAQSAVQLAELIIDASFEGRVGLADQADAGYWEYRAKYLAIGATKVLIGQGTGRASDRIRLDLGNNASTVIVTNTARSRSQNDESAVSLLCNSSASVINVIAGDVGIARLGEETATLGDLLIGSAGTARVGYNVTMTTLTSEGNANVASSVTTVTQNGGTVVVFDAQVTTLNLNAGTCRYFSNATITTATIAGTLNLSGDARAKTISSCTVKRGGRIVDPSRTLTATGGIIFASDVDEIIAA